MNLQFTSLDILYLSLAIGFIVLVAFLVFLILKTAKTLNSLNILIEDVDDTAGDIRQLKNTVKGSIFTVVSMIFGTLVKIRR